MATKKPPKWKTVKLSNLDPTRGLAALMAVNPTPEGYVFHSMNRKVTTATIKYLREDCVNE